MSIPLIADLEKDGIKEIITCTKARTAPNENSALNVTKFDATQMQGFPIVLPSTPVNYACGDINNDGFLYIIIRTYNSILAYNRIRAMMPGFPISITGSTALSFIALFDLDI